MLAIRMQRTGRKGHAMYRVVVQDSRRTPTSGRVVAQLGSYDPHAKTAALDKTKADFYLSHGAQPSDRVVRLLKHEGVALPAWVIDPAAKSRLVRHADKRRSTTIAEAEPEPVAEPEAETPTEAITTDETPQNDPTEDINAKPVAEPELPEAAGDDATNEPAITTEPSSETPDTQVSEVPATDESAAGASKTTAKDDITTE
jgi:small subunit ribosomal protein S16